MRPVSPFSVRTLPFFALGLLAVSLSLSSAGAQTPLPQLNGFVGFQNGTSVGGVTMICITVCGDPGAVGTVFWENPFGNGNTSEEDMGFIIPNTPDGGELSFVFIINQMPVGEDRLLLRDESNGEFVDVCEGNWLADGGDGIVPGSLVRIPGPSSPCNSVGFVFELDGFPSGAEGICFATLSNSNVLRVQLQHNISNPTDAFLALQPGKSLPMIISNFLLGAGSPISEGFALTPSQAVEIVEGNGIIVVNGGNLTATSISGQISNGFSTSVFISEYCNDPAGGGGLGIDTNGDGVQDSNQDEMIEIVNATCAAVDLSNWDITSDDGKGPIVRHVFPFGTFLPPGAAVVVFGGGSLVSFNDGGFGMLASSGGLFFGDGFGTITVRDSTGATVDSTSYVSGGPSAGSNESVTRDPEIPGATFTAHASTGNEDAHSAGFYNSNEFRYPGGFVIEIPMDAYTGNGTDAAALVKVNGNYDNLFTNEHEVVPGDQVEVELVSPTGTLSQSGFVAAFQIFDSANPVPEPYVLPGDSMGSLFFDITQPSVVIADSFFGLLGPMPSALDGFTFSSVIPALPPGTEVTVLLTVIVLDPGHNLANLGVIPAHSLIVHD